MRVCACMCACACVCACVETSQAECSAARGGGAKSGSRAVACGLTGEAAGPRPVGAARRRLGKHPVLPVGKGDRRSYFRLTRDSSPCISRASRLGRCTPSRLLPAEPARALGCFSASGLYPRRHLAVLAVSQALLPFVGISSFILVGDGHIDIGGSEAERCSSLARVQLVTELGA